VVGLVSVWGSGCGSSSSGTDAALGADGSPGLDAAVDRAGPEVAGVDGAGIDAARIDVAGIDAARTDGAGIDAARTDGAGIDAARIDVAGIDVAGIDQKGVDGAGGGSPFTLLVTETPPGPYIDQSLWSGVLAFTVAGDGAPLVPAAGIDKSLLADPACVAFRASSSEVFVGNRHGVNAADGVPGSISRFIYNGGAGTLTAHGTIVGNSLSAVAQIAFSPLTGEMFVADFNYPTSGPSISRFTFDAAGNAIANGTLGNGPTGGVAVAPDGRRLYATSGGQTSSIIRQFDLANGGAPLADVTIAEAPRLFNMAVRNGVLYVAAVDVNKVYRLTIGAADDLTLKDSIAADGAVAVAFSPDGNEMFTAAHLTSEFIDRFSLNASADTWTSTTKVMTTSSLGGILVLQ